MIGGRVRRRLAAGAAVVLAGAGLVMVGPGARPASAVVTPSVSAGGFHTCGVRTDATVACWGDNTYGQAAPPTGTFTQVSAGKFHTCGVRSDATVACWGDNTDGQAAPPAGTFTQVSAGTSHTCGVRTNATVACWGSNSSGKATPPAGTFTQVSAGDWHTCGVRSDGPVLCWGSNGSGEATPPSHIFTQVSAGSSHTCGVRTNGLVACWGYDIGGQTTPPAGTFTQVSAGVGHTCGVRTDGPVACWGSNGAGQATPPAGSFTQVSAGSYHNCGVRTDGPVACWGDNTNGQANPSVASPAPPGAGVGVPYSHQLTTTFESPAATFVVSAGGLPPGLALSPTGVLSGTPTAPGSFGPITVSATNGLAPVATQSFTIAVVAGRYTPLTPARILDTRDGTGAPVGPIGPGNTALLQVTGRGGVPAAGVAAVALNVTVTQPTAQSFLTAYPSGLTRPLAANLNFVPGQTVPNLVVAKVGDDGKVAIYNFAGSTHVVADVAGWYSAPTSAGNDGRLQPLTPARILDTRDGTGGGFRLSPGQSFDMVVAGRGGVPGAGAGAAVMNIAVTNTDAVSYLTAYPTGEARPLAANLNWVPGLTVSNRAMVKLGAGGKVTLYNNSGSTDVVVDVGGWYTDASAAGTTGTYIPLTPARVLDTRDGTGGIAAPVGPGATVDVQVAGRGGVPAAGATAVVLNVTVTQPTAASFFTMFPTGEARPLASDLNFAPGENRPNLVVVKLGAGGKVSLFNNLGSAHVVVDVAGWFS